MSYWNYFRKISILISGGLKPENIKKYEKTVLQNGQSHAAWRFSIVCYLKTVHCKSLQIFVVFYPKWRNMTSLKRNFLN